MVEEGRFNADQSKPGSFLARREALEKEHGCVFTLLGSKGQFKTEVRWVGDKGKRYVTDPALPTEVIPKLEAWFAGATTDVSWFHEETAQ